MIPFSYLTEWQNKVPWNDPDMVEKDLMICRAIVELFSEPYLSENLAFRGGTALNKLYIDPQPRFSEDIDMVQVHSMAIKETIRKIRKQLSFLEIHEVRQKAHNNTIVFRYDSESNPGSFLKLKIEINCREHFSVLGFNMKEFKVDSGWFTGECFLKTYLPEELIGTKLRALYQRSKGRDLYDLFKAVTTLRIDKDKVISSYIEYMNFSVKKPPTKKQYIQNVEKKISDSEFTGDIKALIRPGENYESSEAWGLIKSHLVDMF